MMVKEQNECRVQAADIVISFMPDDKPHHSLQLYAMMEKTNNQALSLHIYERFV